jgi:hypothetical protein
MEQCFYLWVMCHLEWQVGVSYLTPFAKFPGISVFQVHGVDAAGQVLVCPQLKRRYVLAFFERLPPCLLGNRGLPPVGDCRKPAFWNLAAPTALARRVANPGA